MLVPGAEGQAGLAAVVCEGRFDASGFWRAAQGLPATPSRASCACSSKCEPPGRSRSRRRSCAGRCRPDAGEDRIFLRQDDGYVLLTPELWQDVTGGRVRL